jgi:hypothetical protein
VVDDHDLVDHLRHLRQVVAGDEHRLALGGEPPKEVAQPSHALGIEAVCRLVEDEQLGIAEQRGRQAQALTHAKRIALHTATRRRTHIDESEHLLHPAWRYMRDRRQHPQVIQPCPSGMQIGRVEHRADASGRPLQFGVRASEDESPALRRLGKAEEHPQGRRLAGSVWAQKAGNGTRVQRKR